MQLNDRIIGVLTVVGGVAVIWGTLGFREIPGQQFGSAFFPRILGVALILTGVALILTSARGALVSLSEMLRGRAAWQVLAVFVAVVGWIFLSPLLGFIATTTLLITLLVLLAGGRLIPAALTAVAMAVLLYIVFGILLRVPLPFGIIEILFI